MSCKVLKLLLFISSYIHLISPSCSASVNKIYDSPAKFNAETTVFLNDIAGRDKEAGIKIKSTLTVEPIWKNSVNSEYLLKLQISSPRMWTRRVIPNAEFLPHPSGLDVQSKIISLVHVDHGLVSNIYTQTDNGDLLNYVRSLASVFQFQLTEDEHNETDVSGTCSVMYEELAPHVFRKYKHSCTWSTSNPAQSMHLTRYTFKEDQLFEVFAEEVHEVQYSEGSPGVKARVWVQLTREKWSSGVRLFESFEAAMEEWQPLLKFELPLTVGNYVKEPIASLSDVINKHRTGFLMVSVEEDNDELKMETAAEAIAQLTVAINKPGVKTKHIEQALEDDSNRDILWGILISIGASGSYSGLLAVGNALKSDAEQHRYLMKHYLAALATTQHATDELVLEVVRVHAGVGIWSIWRDVTADAIMAAAELTNVPTISEQVKIKVKETITEALSKCKEAECKAVYLRAIGNLRREDTIELLLQSAENDIEPLSAIEALSTINAHAFTAKHIHRLGEISMRPYKVDVCTLAMYIGMRVSAEQGTPALFPFEVVATKLQRFGPHELKKMFWQLLHSLTDSYPILRSVEVYLIRNYDELSNWNARAHHGLSSAMFRSVPGPSVNVSLSSLQAVANAALRRALVLLQVHEQTHAPKQLFAVDVRTEGLDSLSGASESSDEELSASLFVCGIGGSRSPGVRLFAGQSQLLGLVWSGAASTPTRAATRGIVRSASGLIPTGSGVLMKASYEMGVLLDLIGQAQVSLWNRVADTKLFLRGGVYYSSSLSTINEWSELSVNVRTTVSPYLTVSAIIDFSDNVRLCVNTRTHSYGLIQNITKTEAIPGGTHRTLRSYDSHLNREGVTLSLDRNNNAQCSDMQ